MAIYRDEVLARTSLAQIRAAFAPRVFKKLTAVPVEAGGVRARIEIARLPHPSTKSNVRTWLICSCGAKTQVIGVVTDDDGQPMWKCARCSGGWRTRNRPDRRSSS